MCVKIHKKKCCLVWKFLYLQEQIQEDISQRIQARMSMICWNETECFDHLLNAACGITLSKHSEFGTRQCMSAYYFCIIYNNLLTNWLLQLQMLMQDLFCNETNEKSKTNVKCYFDCFHMIFIHCFYNYSIHQHVHCVQCKTYIEIKGFFHIYCYCFCFRLILTHNQATSEWKKK